MLAGGELSNGEETGEVQQLEDVGGVPIECDRFREEQNLRSGE